MDVVVLAVAEVRAPQRALVAEPGLLVRATRTVVAVVHVEANALEAQ